MSRIPNYDDHADYLASKWQREADEADDEAEDGLTAEDRRDNARELRADAQRDEE